MGIIIKEEVGKVFNLTFNLRNANKAAIKIPSHLYGKDEKQ